MSVCVVLFVCVCVRVRVGIWIGDGLTTISNTTIIANVNTDNQGGGLYTIFTKKNGGRQIFGQIFN